MSVLKTLTRVVTMGRATVLGLPRESTRRDPIELFGEWFDDARRADLPLPESMCLVTCTELGYPSGRMVLLKHFDGDGFVFYTNYGSRKAQELDANPHAACVFHWTILQRQVRIEGDVTRISEQQSNDYFASRPRGSQIGAWSSRQSAPLNDTDTLRHRFKEFSERYADEPVPRPPFWGGYRLRPTAIEFWQGRANRLHDRLRFICRDAVWESEWLQP